jgi:7-keto-8-aminopelargonate synthetase-like enzyme
VLCYAVPCSVLCCALLCAALCSMLQVFRILSESSELVEKLQANVVQFRSQMKAAGFTLSGADTHAIAPVSEHAAAALRCDEMK